MLIIFKSLNQQIGDITCTELGSFKMSLEKKYYRQIFCCQQPGYEYAFNVLILFLSRYIRKYSEECENKYMIIGVKDKWLL